MSDKLRVPKKDGLKRVRANLEKILDKEPTDELVRIVNENNRHIEQERGDDEMSERDRAARPIEKSIDSR